MPLRSALHSLALSLLGAQLKKLLSSIPEAPMNMERLMDDLGD